ncbi:MAG: bL17 family ribosomal protein [Candidatus Berkelbacteria bacterium]|nr:bL17 family ribosomal protein [Candidatus Berkelbacteria bacterium]
MKHSKSRSNSQRLLRNQLSSLIINESIITTRDKARTLKQEASRMIEFLKKSKFEATDIRKIKLFLYAGAQKKAVNEGGVFTGITSYKLGYRSGDSAPLEKVILIKSESKQLKDKKAKKNEDSKA